MLLANLPITFLCNKAGLNFEEFLSYFVSTAVKSLLVLSTPINTGYLLTKWNIALLHTLYKRDNNFSYLLLTTDLLTLASFEEIVQKL